MDLIRLLVVVRFVVIRFLISKATILGLGFGLLVIVIVIIIIIIVLVLVFTLIHFVLFVLFVLLVLLLIIHAVNIEVRTVAINSILSLEISISTFDVVNFAVFAFDVEIASSTSIGVAAALSVLPEAGLVVQPVRIIVVFLKLVAIDSIIPATFRIGFGFKKVRRCVCSLVLARNHTPAHIPTCTFPRRSERGIDCANTVTQQNIRTPTAMPLAAAHMRETWG
jgi:hypothetical protein